jgi:hypothetical protein
VEHNEFRPHSPLGDLTPREFTKRTAAKQTDQKSLLLAVSVYWVKTTVDIPSDNPFHGNGHNIPQYHALRHLPGEPPRLGAVRVELGHCVSLRTNAACHLHGCSKWGTRIQSRTSRPIRGDWVSQQDMLMDPVIDFFPVSNSPE